MKVTGIIGSLRKDSIHRQFFKHYQELCSEHFQMEEGTFREFPIFNQDLPAPDCVGELGAQISDSRGVIFFTPEYNYSIPGGLKNAIDWLSRVESKPFNNKPVAIVGGSPGNVGTARCQYHLRQVGVFLNMQILNKPEVMISKAFDKLAEGKISDEKTVDFLKTHAGEFKSFMEKCN